MSTMAASIRSRCIICGAGFDASGALIAFHRREACGEVAKVVTWDSLGSRQSAKTADPC
jgi:hypothetical protein